MTLCILKGKNEIMITVPVTSHTFRGEKNSKVTKNIPKLKKGNTALKCTSLYLAYLKPSWATKDRISKRRVEIVRDC